MLRIVNAAHFARVSTLIAATKGRVIIGGQFDKDNLRISPTIVAFEEGSNWEEDPLMISENFGPILPVVVASASDPKESGVGVFGNAVDYVRSR